MMPIDVVTVWAPRPNDPHWSKHYLLLLALQRDTARQFGHRHVVVTDDASLHGFEKLIAPLPKDLMPAMIDGVLSYLAQHQGRGHTVFVDADCLIARDLDGAFAGDEFDIGLTRRDDAVAPINNGAMYVHRDADMMAIDFFSRAFDLCGTHWGADQEAISQAAAPVPEKECIEDRNGMRLAFLSMRMYGVVPKARAAKHFSNPYVVHFKGETKAWAREYADRYILNGEAA